MNLRLSLICILISACATHKTEQAIVREPSSAVNSSVKEENLKISFTNIMNSKGPEKEFLIYFEQLKSLFVRAEASLGDFDKELDESQIGADGFSFENSRSYKKMIIMWELSHHLQDKILYYYTELNNISADKNQKSSMRKLAKNILNKINAKLDSNDPLEKFSYDELKRSIESTNKENTVTSKVISGGAPSSIHLPISLLQNQQAKIKLFRQYRKEFRMLGKKEQMINDELNQKIESDTDKLELIDQSGRVPGQANLIYYPSPGPNGNIMGLSFPKNVWALTFDDGPNPKHTPEIIRNLNEQKVKATFFWLAENVIRYQSVVDLAKENGFARENHSWTHPQLPKLDDNKLQKEIIGSTEIETQYYGEKPRFFRCPYGAGNSIPRIRKMIANTKLIHVFWNVDTLDWQDKDPDSIVERTKKQMATAGHGVILFHDVHPQSVIASKKLVEWSKTLKNSENKIRWVTLPEIVNEMNGAEK